MTAHDLHDALNLLPSDLITAADKVRTGPKPKAIPWRHMAVMAAVLTLVIGTTIVFGREFRPYLSDAKMESAAQAPAAMAPPLMEDQKVTADAAAPEVPVADETILEVPAEEAGTPEPPSDVGAPEVPYQEAGGSVNGMKEELDIDHSHRFAEETENAGSTGAYCGNTVTVIHLDGKTYSFGGSDSVMLTRILKNLPYDPVEVCRCMAEFTVDTETLTGIQVNLDQAFARCELGQAALTEDQANTIRAIIDSLR